MNLLQRLKHFFSKKKVAIPKDEYPKEAQELIMEVFKTGKPMIGWYDEHGKFHSKVIEK